MRSAPGSPTLLASAALVVLAFTGCASSAPAVYEEDAAFASLEAERDSLRAVATVQDELLVAYADSIRALRRRTPARRGAAEPARPADPRAIPPGPPQRAENPADPAASDTLYADELFAPASANLTEAGRALLDRVLYELGRTAPDARLRIEGHGDSTPPGPTLRDRYPSNWELAAARASAVARYLIELGVAERRIEVVSLAATRPVASDDTPEGRARNRRIVVRAL